MNDKYLHFNLDDFLNDDSFISYAKNPESDDKTRWDKWLLAHPQKVNIYNEANLIINSLQFKEDILDKSQIDKNWDKIYSNINKETSTSERGKLPFMKIAISVAAAIILIGFVTSIWGGNNNLTATSRGEISSLVLPDSSVVEINVDSKISFDKKNWEKERKLSLKGEAFFNVKKGDKFSVYTNKVIVEVLGTSFNVYDRGMYVDVRCETGKVRVINKMIKDTIILNPGFGAKMLGTNKLETYNFHITDKNTWKDGIISFENQSLKFVFEELERQYNIKVIVDKTILTKKYTGYFLIGDLEKSLYSICWPMHLKYEIQKNKVNITNKN